MVFISYNSVEGILTNIPESFDMDGYIVKDFTFVGASEHL